MPAARKRDAIQRVPAEPSLLRDVSAATTALVDETESALVTAGDSPVVVGCFGGLLGVFDSGPPVLSVSFQALKPDRTGLHAPPEDSMCIMVRTRPPDGGL